MEETRPFTGITRVRVSAHASSKWQRLDIVINLTNMCFFPVLWALELETFSVQLPVLLSYTVIVYMCLWLDCKLPEGRNAVLQILLSLDFKAGADFRCLVILLN